MPNEPSPTRPSQPGPSSERAALRAACALVIVTYCLCINLRGISTDEGLRLAIMNGGESFTSAEPGTKATWGQVLATNSFCAYQPLYFLIQNTLVRVAHTHDAVFLRLVNVFFLWVSLEGLIALSREWRLLHRLFLIGLFSFNAYLFMHVLQIREYAAGISFYIWSTWLTLRLDARKLERPWADASWFLAYGILLVLGFYLQTWVVFPAIAQGIFLIARRRNSRGRFYGYLALSYVAVLSATLQYVLGHPQKINVGRWGSANSALWPQLSSGFHLVVTGHVPHTSQFTDLLFCFWLAALVGAGLLLFRKSSLGTTEAPRAEFVRQGTLMILSGLIPLAFQVGYFFKVDSLSVWPRYFVIYYFFWVWLVALAFRFVDELRRGRDVSNRLRGILTAVVGVSFALMVTSGIFQTRSYYRNPYFDTSLSPTSNWQIWAAELSRALQPDDVVFMYDFISRATLTFTQAIPNHVLLLQDLEQRDLTMVNRAVYFESVYVLGERSQLAARMAARGFTVMRESRMYLPDRETIIPEWRLVIFSRR